MAEAKSLGQETLLGFLQNLLSSAQRQPCRVLFEVEDGVVTLFSKLLKSFLEKRWQITYAESALCQPTALFQTKTAFGGLWLKMFASEESEEGSPKQNDLPLLLNKVLPNDDVFVFVKKATTKDQNLLATHDFTFIKFDKRFYLRHFFQIASQLLVCSFSSSKSALIIEKFGGYTFTDFDAMLCFVSLLSMVAANNLLAFQKIYASYFGKENCFKLSQHLLGERPSASKFFATWQSLRDDFPIQFWTAFFLNRTWTSILTGEHQQPKYLQKQKQLYTDLYLADLASKQVGFTVFLEPIFFSYFEN